MFCSAYQSCAIEQAMYVTDNAGASQFVTKQRISYELYILILKNVMKLILPCILSEYILN